MDYDHALNHHLDQIDRLGPYSGASDVSKAIIAVAHAIAAMAIVIREANEETDE